MQRWYNMVLANEQETRYVLMLCWQYMDAQGINEVMAKKHLDERGDWRNEATITVQEYGRLMHVSRNTAYANVRAGKVPIINVGGCIRVSVPGLLRQLEEAADTVAA
jgi:hypothetical protein